MDILEKVRKAEEKLHCTAFIPDRIGTEKRFISVKDNLCVKGMPAQAGSKILEGYVPPFSATAIERLQKKGFGVCAKTVMDEFGFGTFNVNTFKIPKNPHDKERSTGGSSGGGAALCAETGIPGIVESTGGSITAPAAFCGVVGVTPTWGLISRRGLIDYASSMDKIGTVSTTVREAFELVHIMAGPDGMDSTCQEKKNEEKPLKKKVALPRELWEKTDSKTRRQAQLSVSALEKEGIEVLDISLKMTEESIYAYYLLAMCEASMNLAKFCGLRYGQQPPFAPEESYEDYFSKVRASFGTEAKRRLLLGSFARTSGYRGKYYEKAAKVRTLVIQELKRFLNQFDVFLTPSMPCVAPKFSEIKKLTPLEHYSMDVCTVAWNLAGLPHASVPFGNVESLPVGVQVIGDHFAENTVQYYSEMIERNAPKKN